MSVTYIQLNLSIQPLKEGRDIVLAVLSDLGFESFIENANGLEAYIQAKDWRNDFLDALYPLEQNGMNIAWSLSAIPPKNWNSVWESDFQPIIVEDKCAVRADFHTPISVPYELVITPKMSFGTGHHQTTYLMLSYLLQYPPKNQCVLDMGCGTGVLAILAEKLGATAIDAVDVASWCYQNTLENIESNQCEKIQAFEGDREVIPSKIYDTILANINMNTLLLDIPLFTGILQPKGNLFLSGFYTQDIPAIESKANQNGFILNDFQEKNNWVAAHFIKQK